MTTLDLRCRQCTRLSLDVEQGLCGRCRDRNTHRLLTPQQRAMKNAQNARRRLARRQKME